jgi:hypothetical protein
MMRFLVDEWAMADKAAFVFAKLTIALLTHNEIVNIRCIVPALFRSHSWA